LIAKDCHNLVGDKTVNPQMFGQIKISAYDETTCTSKFNESAMKMWVFGVQGY
jgi:hypothetical protein